MEINGIAHIFLTASNYERSREFYRRLLPFLGLKPVIDTETTYYCVGGRIGQSNVRTFPTTLPGVRFMNHHLLDLGMTKNFDAGRHMKVQVRIEALNATNYTLFNSGNMTLTPNNATFMELNNIDSSTVMKPRDIQLGVRLTF